MVFFDKGNFQPNEGDFPHRDKNGAIDYIVSADLGSFMLKEDGEWTEYKAKDGRVFEMKEAGEKVVELTGLATDKNPHRSWALAFFVPKGQSSNHYHDDHVEEYHVLSGNGTLILDGQEIALSPGVNVTIEKGNNHQVFNTSDTETLVMVVPCWKAWEYEDMHEVESEPTPAAQIQPPSISE